jgi:hypothetical protein
MRFRPRFSLRALFVAITILAAIMAWGVYERKLITDRGAGQAWIMMDGMDSGAVIECAVGEPAKPPWHVRLWCSLLFLGSPSSVYYVKMDAAKLDASHQPERLQRLFPEARFDVVSAH